MSTATIEKPRTVNSLEAAKASLRAEFERLIGKAPDAVIIKAASLSGGQALAAVLEKPEQSLSVEARNQIAISQMKARSFESLKGACHLIDANAACSILVISRQALAKKVKVGHVLAYTQNHRKHYPDFQFGNNKVRPVIALLIKELGLDTADETQANLLIQFLVQLMDYSNPGEEENVVPRYTLLEDKAAFDIIVRDFKNRLEMGK
ncbi:hypothetical protein IFU04_25240 [Pseudomonas syringae]|nr:hypothetical protein [Pseudomonas syringae]